MGPEREQNTRSPDSPDSGAVMSVRSASPDSTAESRQWPGRYFLNGREVCEQEAYAAESEGARVALGGSGDTPDRLGGGPGPWMELRYG